MEGSCAEERIIDRREHQHPVVGFCKGLHRMVERRDDAGADDVPLRLNVPAMAAMHPAPEGLLVGRRQIRVPQNDGVVLQKLAQGCQYLRRVFIFHIGGGKRDNILFQRTVQPVHRVPLGRGQRAAVYQRFKIILHRQFSPFCCPGAHGQPGHPGTVPLPRQAHRSPAQNGYRQAAAPDRCSPRSLSALQGRTP